MAAQVVKWTRDIGRSGPDGVGFRADATVTITLSATTYATGGLALAGASFSAYLRQAGLANVRRVTGFSGWVVLPSGAYQPAIIEVGDINLPKLKILFSNTNGLTFEEVANGVNLGSGTITLKLFAHGDMA